ncbi:MAG: translation initiation factor IF-2 [Bacteroidetes bacterium]|nr:translation initiation factor IF-2 [Bacteroidota bacterium]
MSTDNKFKKVRLFKLAKEFNVSVDALVEHITEAGHADSLVGAGINAAVATEMAYEDLMDFFADDKVQADRLSRKRAAMHETEEEGEPSGDAPEKGPEDATAPEAVEEAEAAPAAPAPEPEPKTVADEPKPAPETTPKEVVVAEEPDPEPVAEEVEEVVEATVEPAQEIEEVKEAPEAADTAVVVDETPPPAAEEDHESSQPESVPAPVTPENSAETAVTEDPVSPTDEIAVGDEATLDEAEAALIDPAALFSADRYKLTGTKILGKIDLGTVEDSEPGAKRKRKRKRTRIESAEDSAGKTKPAPASPDAKGKKATKKSRKKGPAVDEKDVEATLQETLRELEAGASRVRQKRRRQRRDSRAAERERADEEQQDLSTTLEVTEFISTGELANLMEVPVTEVISTLFAAGMVVSINQRLDADTITIVADEFGFDIEFLTDFTGTDVTIAEDDPADLIPRAPVVTVMGHVDHGKTSLLDYIRSEDVVAGEAGGITQHIGAYQVKLKSGKDITFLDTPGHEAFTAMRARGAQVTDVVVLVVAADDAVMPQTVEAINHAQAAGVPIVVAINKMDKDGANPDRVMQQLADKNVLVEQWGGKIQCEQVSAHSGLGIPELLDKVLLEAELLDLKANPNRNAVSAVIESRLEKGRGNVATVLVQNGTLKVGDPFLAGIWSGRVRAMFDERDRRVSEVGPSQPALVIGLDGSPAVGDTFLVLDTEKETKDLAARRQQIQREQSLRQRKHITLDEIGRRLALGDFRELNLIVKGDVAGSVEALSDSLMKLGTEEVVVNIIHKGVGAINESDVVLASASDAIIVGFQVRPVLGARKAAEREEIDIRLYSVIYHAIEEVKDALEGLLSPERSEKIIGVAEVRDTFKVPKQGTIAGCHVIEGRINRSDKIHLIREGVVIYDGKLASLKRFKDDVREVLNGYECGMGIENFNDLKVGDQIESYEIIETKRTLDD